MYIALFLVVFIVSDVSCQQAGTLSSEDHPPLSFQHCTKSGCDTISGSVTLDSNWRWTHSTSGSTNCYTGNTWDTSICPDPITCAKSCAIDGADYEGTYGITSDGNSLTLGFVTHGPYSTNIGSRVYLLASDTEYQIFNLVNQEFAFDVDLSNLPCGLNGALYFVEMEADGGMSEYPTNGAGAKYGTGYCDSQCPRDMKFIDGQANTIDWTPDPNNPNSGTGSYGTCCAEMDIWEANSMATAVTPHVCTVKGQYRCNGTDCGDGADRYSGVCDKDGCDFNPYRVGNQDFFGNGMQVDTSQPFTVVTQFIANDTSNLVEIRRFYRQNDVTILNPKSNFTSLSSFDSVSDSFCNAQKSFFGDKNDFEALGGMAQMGTAMANGMVLVLSLWDDYAAHMLWLDSAYPPNGTITTPGVARGSCSTSSGVPSQVENEYPNAHVIFSNIKYGDIGTTTPM